MIGEHKMSEAIFKNKIHRETVEVYYWPKFQRDEEMAGGEIRAMYLIPEFKKISKNRAVTVVPSEVFKDGAFERSAMIRRLLVVFLFPLYMRRIFPKKKYTISFVYCSTCYAWELLPALVLRLFRRFKIVCVSHDTPAQLEGYNFYRKSEMKGIIKSIIMTGIEKLQEFLLRFVDVPIAISSFAMDFFSPSHIRSRALLSSNGVPTIYPSKESIHHRKFDIVYVGRVIERKNLRTVLKALSLFQQDINFLLITNSSEDHVSSLINENLTNDHVSVTVKYKVNEEDKYLLLNDSKISINLSYDENFSISTLETAACGNALVLSNRDFFRQIYGDAAVYADPFDAAAVFTCIESLLIDQGELDRMSDMALSIAEKYQYSNIAMTEYSEIRKAVEKNS